MIFTIDVEDWSQSVLNKNNPVTDRVLHSTNKVLDLLDQYGHKGTFFILGNVAKKHPQLIRDIADQGHEVASHGMDHKNIHALTPEEVHADVEYSVNILEDTGGKKVIGYRAPNFSIREEVFEWYCEALSKNNLKYDSSLFPMKVIKYGIEREYSLKIFNEFHIREHYLSYVNVGKYKLPFFGGGYFRLLPYAATKHLTKQLNQDRGVFYMHPYEVDPEEYDAIKGKYEIPLKWKLTQFVRRKSVEPKLHRLFKDFEFTSFEKTYYSQTEDIRTPSQRYNETVAGNSSAAGEVVRAR